MLAEDIKITIPDLLREPETSRPFAPLPKRLLQGGALVRALEVIVETQNKQQEQEAALARLPGMFEDLEVRDSQQGQRSRKRGRESAEDAIQLERQARKHYAVPPESVRTVAASTATGSRKSTKARQPSRAGRPGHGEPASQVPRAVARPPFEVEMLEDQDDDANDLLDARAQRYRRARTAPPRAKGERRL